MVEQRRNLATLIAVLPWLLIGLADVASGHAIVDQRFDAGQIFLSLDVARAQTFLAGAVNLAAIEIPLRHQPQGSAVVRVSIHSGNPDGPVLASQEAVFSYARNRFDFAPPIDLTVGDTYSISVEPLSGVSSWRGRQADPNGPHYPDGEAWDTSFGSWQPTDGGGWDLQFRTYTWDPSVDPTDLELLNHTGRTAPARPRLPASAPPLATPLRRVDPNTGGPLSTDGPVVCEYRAAGGGSTVDLSQSVGPDADPATLHDNLIPTVGNCLLWDSPVGDEVQVLRPPEAVAADHPTDQLPFHALCTETYQEDLFYERYLAPSWPSGETVAQDNVGSCRLDQFNNPEVFSLLAELLAGLWDVPNETVPNLETIRLTQLPWREQLSRTALDRMFGKIIGMRVEGQRPPEDADGSFALGFDLHGTQAALAGCGPAFVAPCGTFAMEHGWVWDDDDPDDRSGSAAMGAATTDTGRVPTGSAAAGIDLMNADGGAITQEFTPPRDKSVGVMVGTRRDGPGGPLRWEAGITLAGQAAVERAVQGHTAELFYGMTLSERADYLEQALGVDFSVDPGNLDPLYGGRVGVEPTDGWIEPFPWVLDPEAAARGVIRYQVANQLELDPRCDPELRHDPNDPTQTIPRETDVDGNPVFSSPEISYCQGRQALWSPTAPLDRPVLNDPTDASNPANVFYGDFDNALRVSESCASFLRNEARDLVGETDFSEGCTKLETLSANLERLSMTWEIIGSDQRFDPPETAAELIAALGSGSSDDVYADFVSGADGIFVDNFNLFDEEGYFDIQVVEYLYGPSGEPDIFDLTDPDNIVLLDVDGDSRVSALEFFQVYDPRSPDFCPGSANCLLKVGEAWDLLSSRFGLTRPLVADLPIRWQSAEVQLGGIWVPQPSGTGIDLLKIEMEDPAALNDLMQEQPIEACLSNYDAQGQCATPLVPVRLRGHDASTLRRWDLDSTADPRIAAPETGSVYHPDLNWNYRWDTTYDGVDDYIGSGHPVSDDNILCGSGIPGDVLNEGIQYELSEPELQKAIAFFGDWDEDGQPDIPPRSPVFCRSVTALLDLTIADAEGRRDFIWHARYDDGDEVLEDGDGSGIAGDNPCSGDATTIACDDNCPTIANGVAGDAQADFDGDGVGDACDNCRYHPNPPASYPFYRTTTGGQLDDDADGYGNACDKRFHGEPGSTHVTVPEWFDVPQFKQAFGKPVTAHTCGYDRDQPCDIFDLDGMSPVISALDLIAYKRLYGRQLGPKCDACGVDFDALTCLGDACP
jgi:hypothetical protein